uniref:Uncharacterized protein n=1 Tax=Anguilla anguilla TaxID=7936 RepID=A0A0E9Q1V1_ANGAN
MQSLSVPLLLMSHIF